MRLRIAIPAEHSAALVVVTGPLIASSPEDAHLLDVLVRSATAGIEVDPPTEQQTELGWRYTEVTARVVGAEGVVEHRIAAMYRFAEWRGFVLLRSDPARWDELASVARAALAAVAPDWRGDGEIHCLAHLYE